MSGSNLAHSRPPHAASGEGRHDAGVGGQTPGPTPTCRARLSFSLEKAPLPGEGLSAVPAVQRERAPVPLPGVGRAGSNFPTMCKLVNLRVCKPAFEGPLMKHSIRA